jgi:hypothetical protein
VCWNGDDEDVPLRKEVIPTILYSVIHVSIHCGKRKTGSIRAEVHWRYVSPCRDFHPRTQSLSRFSSMSVSSSFLTYKTFLYIDTCRYTPNNAGNKVKNSLKKMKKVITNIISKE